MINRLTQRAKVLKKSITKNEIGELLYKYIEFKDIYCQVIPLTIKNNQNDKLEQIEANFKVITRRKTIEDLDTTIRLKIDGKTLEVLYWNIDYKRNEYVEIYCYYSSNKQQGGA